MVFIQFTERERPDMTTKLPSSDIRYFRDQVVKLGVSCMLGFQAMRTLSYSEDPIATTEENDRPCFFPCIGAAGEFL